MNDAAARQVLLVRAFETTPGAPWSDADREWASAQALRRAPAVSPAEALIEHRSAAATERLRAREPGLARVLAATGPVTGVTIALGVGAALVGLLSDAIGSSRHINLLAPPLLALMVWNLAVYAALGIAALRRPGTTTPGTGPLRALLAGVVRKVTAFSLPRIRSRAVVDFLADWADAGRPLHTARLAQALHLAAAAFALGALASMYARGLAFDYRAGWDSTFLDAEAVRRVLAVALWPATALGAIALPDAARLAELRFANGPGENAARWIHAYAASVLVVVVLPRCLLALRTGWRARRLASDFPLALSGPYFDALLARLAAAPRPGGGHARQADPAFPARSVVLSLVSHTNVGKTTLARTLLREDIGEVRDAEHVTFAAEGHTLVESPEGDRLELWDTPGFGDSVRLADRLARSETPVGWFLAEVWDRVRDRGFWSTQHAVRHVVERADVVLYLVDASHAPDDLAMLQAELHVLDLLHKPVIVLLNRLGAPKPPAALADEIEAWRERLARQRCVRDVLALDAFTRSWVEEGTLLDAVARVLPKDVQTAFGRLVAAWHTRSRAVWQASMRVQSQRLARAALAHETITEGDWAGKLMDVGAGLGLRRRGASTSREKAMQRLAERLADEVAASTDELIALHGLHGRSSSEVLAVLAEHVAAAEPLDEGRAALWGGIASGALLGLKADLLAGGLTLGGGMLAGGIVGALGAAGLARGYNQVRGVETPTLAWSPAALDTQTGAALLAYLAVAHHGRGRGAWAAHDQPRFWAQAVETVLGEYRDRLHAVWALRDEGDAGRAALASTLEGLLLRMGEDTLYALYPASQRLRGSA
jgi:hypothetical protein